MFDVKLSVKVIKRGKGPFDGIWEAHKNIFSFSTPSTTTYATGCNKCILLLSFFDLLSTNFTSTCNPLTRSKEKERNFLRRKNLLRGVLSRIGLVDATHGLHNHVRLRYLENTVNNLNPPFLTCYLLLVLLHVRRLDEEWM